MVSAVKSRAEKKKQEAGTVIKLSGFAKVSDAVYQAAGRDEAQVVVNILQQDEKLRARLGQNSEIFEKVAEAAGSAARYAILMLKNDAVWAKRNTLPGAITDLSRRLNMYKNGREDFEVLMQAISNNAGLSSVMVANSVQFALHAGKVKDILGSSAKRFFSSLHGALATEYARNPVGIEGKLETVREYVAKNAKGRDSLRKGETSEYAERRLSRALEDTMSCLGHSEAQAEFLKDEKTFVKKYAG